MRLTRRVALAGTTMALAVAGQADAQAPAGRPVVIIVPFTAGPAPDIVARIVAEGMQRRLGQPVVVENRPGASGNIGADAVARAAPDGQTLLLHTTTLVMNAALYRTLPYDPLGSFTPVLGLVDVEYALVLHPDAGGTSVAELLSRARARPGALNFGSPGIGTPLHLTMELFMRAAGVRLTHVPYRGFGPAIAGLLAGEVAGIFMPVDTAAELTRDGRVRTVAVAAEARLPLLPGVPTVAEAGVPGVTMRDWIALLAPARTPAPVVARHTAVAAEVLRMPEVARTLSGRGYNLLATPPEEFRARMVADKERWARVVLEAGISAE
ncbi:Bug family tripartite tricarboxylate transporter substrate binding protein [Paracraurococcus lichenis]|uniref:Tripartite tricarboxylate transporter substrate-binding protein n=1 Tax=Paracraurococcus lichenis TaxID=3064888 RepID=A0ABT9ECS5_9PROT|nr:tripartite tricarboxylate transporter substrate-binding protein [Paracraurococcus sp. LOR1-02]MDO9714009.1 tripartite tricarboxylate transporter substrate-binding protein [Paracraurococcus sp. LOR1-02]